MAAAPLRNRQPQSCADCRTLVHPYQGRLYVHDKKNPPPPGVHGSRSTSPKYRKKLTIWVVRCEICAQRYDQRQEAERLEELLPDGPWWAA